MNIILNGKEITFTTDQYNDLVDHVVKEQKRKNGICIGSQRGRSGMEKGCDNSKSRGYIRYVRKI